MEAYETVGGIVLRDLFQGDGGGWLQDVVVWDRLVVRPPQREAEALRAGNWRSNEIAPVSIGVQQFWTPITPQGVNFPR